MKENVRKMSSLTKLLDVALLRISLLRRTISHKRPLIRILTNNADYDRYFCLEKKSVFSLIDNHSALLGPEASFLFMKQIVYTSVGASIKFWIQRPKKRRKL